MNEYIIQLLESRKALIQATEPKTKADTSELELINACLATLSR